jgi:beta-phosphoglucomutase-like phosphatase (HAD superfamily)
MLDPRHAGWQVLPSRFILEPAIRGMARHGGCGMFDLCLFDLDDTLLRTSDLSDIRPQGVGKQDDGAYATELLRRFGDPVQRYIYTPERLASLKTRWPEMKFGIFTRAPWAYVKPIVDLAYPDFDWDTCVVYETVPKGHHKPNGWGIRDCMSRLEIEDPQRVVMVGDETVDVKAAYNAGCYVVLDKASWAHGQWDGRRHFAALELIPDAVISGPTELADVISDIGAYAPKLEWEFNGSQDHRHQPRFSAVNHFYPACVGEADKAREEIHSAGRHFSDYDSLDNRRAWHTLTHSIHQNKDCQVFPVEWCAAVYAFVQKSNPFMALVNQTVTVAAIPARPDRLPRMQHFIAQLHNDFRCRPPIGRTHDSVQFSNDFLAYTAGVRSQSGEHLNRTERFENVRDHLIVSNPGAVRGKDFVIIDDVCTTGATLMYAKKRLIEAGARQVKLLALTKNVSNVLS